MPFRIYRSSAGSGKTFTLVKEYLRIALATDRPDAYREILAITFTNKAAEEMKARVLNTLGRFAEGSHGNHPMTGALLAEVGVSSEILTRRSKNVLRHMLHHYSDLSISTIDHFTHKVIRTFAQDLGLSMNFEVEMDTARLNQQIVDELLLRVGSQKTLTDALIDIAQDQTEDGKSWSVDEKLKQFVSILFKEESRFHLEKLKNVTLEEFSQLRKTLRVKLFKAKDDLRNIANDFNSSVIDKGLSSNSFANGKNGICNFFRKLTIGKFDQPTPTVINNMHDDKWFGSKASNQEKETILEWQDEILWKYQQSLELLQFIEQYQVVFEQIYGIALLDEMNHILQTIQQEEEILHIGEFNHLVSDVVMNESAPFIYERIGCRFHHFLVDEFQDTSVLQWFNLLPLVDESLAHDNLCLVVGDAKQSIYRWRGGDVQQFVALPSIHRTSFLQERLTDRPDMKRLLEQRENVLNDRTEIRTLNTNYRSASSIVNFNNDLFSSLQNRMPSAFKNMYDESAQNVKSEKEGSVEIKFFRQEDAGRSWDEYDTLTLEQCDTWIQACLQDGYMAGDIAIICRRNVDAIRIAQFLIEEGYKVVSNESLLINSSPKVRLLVNISAFLLDSENSTNNAELIYNMSMVREEQHLTSIRLMEANTKEDDNLLSLLSALYPNIDWARLNRESMYGLFESLIHGLFPNDSEAHLQFFLDEVMDLNHRSGNDLAAFHQYWNDKKDGLSISLTENREAIRILTVHKSKGLEFPIVIHPYSDYLNTSAKNSIWVYSSDPNIKPLDRLHVKATGSLENTSFSNDLEHERSLIEMDMYNLLYVALTRPAHRLYVCGKLKKANARDQSPATAIQFIYHHLLNSGAEIDGELSFSIGNAERAPEMVTAPKFLKLHPTGNPNWTQRISISRPSEKQWYKTSDAVKHGLVIHELLSHIKFEDDIKPALLQFVEDGKISNNEVSELEVKLTDLIGKPTLKPLFSTDKMIRNESDIQLATGKWLRPDRVVWKNKKAWVVDYKTGATDSKHQKQVKEYMEAMHQLGFEDVEGILVYIDQDNIVAV